MSHSALILLIGISFVFVFGATGQGRKTRREAYGVERANQVEMLLRSLFPGAQVEWSPALAVRDQSGTKTSVDLGDFAITKQSDGSVNGVALLELGSAKAEHIERVKRFQAAGAPVFTTTIVVFRASPSGQIADLRKVVLDPNDPLTKIGVFGVQHWPEGGWPVLRIHYASLIFSSW